jgi:ABC-type multidrug transport system fused ATPase/permease subunit
VKEEKMPKFLQSNTKNVTGSPKRKDRRNELVKEYLATFLSLKMIDEETKNRLIADIEYHQNTLNTFPESDRIIRIIEVILFISFALPPWIIIYNNSTYLLQYFNFIGNCCIMNASTFSFSNIITFVHHFLLLGIVGLLLGIIGIPILFITFYITSLIKRLYKQITEKRYTLSVIVSNLITILISTEKELGGSMSMRYKRMQVLKLEDTAKCIERSLPQWFYTGNAVTDTWMEERFKQVAASLREKEKWLFTPKEDTHENFKHTIASTLIYFVDGNWDALERIEPEKLTRPQLRTLLTTFIMNALKTILLAAIPIIGFILFQQTQFKLTGPTYGTAQTILSIYALTAVISALDPNFSTKVTNVKAISDLISGSGSKP